MDDRGGFGGGGLPPSAAGEWMGQGEGTIRRGVNRRGAREAQPPGSEWGKVRGGQATGV